MIVIDMFCGDKNWSAAFKDRGHDVFTTDFESKYESDLTADILTLSSVDFPKPDIVLASPPCQSFSVAVIYRNWNKDLTPRSEKAITGVKLVSKALSLIDELKPKFWIIENPRGMLRKMPIMQDLDRRTVTYCQYGKPYMKPTDLWGGFPQSLKLKPSCRNGDPCHERAPRGSRQGVQRRNRKTSTAIPYDLSLEVCLAAEKDLYG